MKKILAFVLVFIPYSLFCQAGSGKESDAFLDSIYKEMDEVLNDMLQPRSFLSISVGAGTGFYNFKSAATTQPDSEKKLLLSPSVSYMHKSGFGVTGNMYVLRENDKFNAYQFSVTPSYDYIKRGQFATGIAYTRFVTKKDLAFYTTPVQNEAYAYFNYRKPWLQPGFALAYGWGSRSSYEERKVQLLGLRKKRNPAIVTLRNDERVNELAALFSIRHNFSWSSVVTGKDLVSFTPVLLLSAGTQSFGFNTSFQTNSKVTGNFLPNNQNVTEKADFDLQSTTLILRGDYSHGIFFVQSQVLFDYFLRDANKNINNAFSVIAGINF